MTATIPVECLRVSALIFYTLHAVQTTFACILGGKTRLFPCVQCSVAGWEVSLPHIFILYIFVYSNYIAMYEHRFCYICLFLFPTKLAHSGDSFV